LRQAHSYVVQLTQDGPALHVVATAPTFLPPSDHFDGRIKPDGIVFQLGGLYTGYGPDSAMTAHLSSTLALSYEGMVYASRAGSAIVGRLFGELQAFEVSTSYKEIGRCDAQNHLFSMSAATGGALR